MQNYRFEFLNKLKAKLGDAVTICDEFDEIGRENFYSVEVNLGTGWAGSYKNKLWGDCAITNDELKLEFTYGDIYGEYEENFGEGFVYLTYVDGSGLAYAGDLDNKIENAVYDMTGGLLHCCGSEQGMQSEEYLSVDVGELVEA